MDFGHAKAAIGLCRRVFAVAQFAFDLDIRTFLQCAGPFRQLVPAVDAMPFGPPLVLVASVLFPAHAPGDGEASVNGAVRAWTEKSNRDSAFSAVRG